MDCSECDENFECVCHAASKVNSKVNKAQVTSAGVDHPGGERGESQTNFDYDNTCSYDPNHSNYTSTEDEVDSTDDEVDDDEECIDLTGSDDSIDLTGSDDSIDLTGFPDTPPSHRYSCARSLTFHLYL